MRFLGVDTSSSPASVAITEHGRVVSENFYPGQTNTVSMGGHGRNNHAEVLLSLVDAALARGGLSLDKLSGFAVAIGPGSFTGLRIGLSTVKGLWYGSGLPLIGISTLHAWASRISYFSGQICVILDARKKEVYGALFRRRDGGLERLTPDEVLSLSELITLLRSIPSREPVLVVGDELTQYREVLRQIFGRQVSFAPVANLPTVASAVALLGEAASGRKGGATELSLVPHYLRLAEAQEKASKTLVTH
jgi:tRNA threonylcarbamoyladenosine biosynthesis protein TsaB